VTQDDAVEAGSTYEGVDLCYELTGAPSVLNTAVQATGYRGRIVVGSWYGTKRADLALGTRFHRSRMRIMSSQVSSIDPELRGRWSKQRRMNEVIRLCDELEVHEILDSETFSLSEASSVYERLVDQNRQLLQPIFEYDSAQPD